MFDDLYGDEECVVEVLWYESWEEGRVGVREKKRTHVKRPDSKSLCSVQFT